jgi:hypothetical protein
MADKKITELDELTAPVAASVLPIVDNPDAVVPVTKKIQFQNLVAVVRDSVTHALYVLLGGGNTRGADAVDLQSLRTDASQVASGIAATVGGGGDNTASGDAATVPGGHSNVAAGDYSVAMGRKANAAHDGAAVMADGTDAVTSSEAENQLVLRYTGGVLIATAVDISGLPTKGIRVPGDSEQIQDLAGNPIGGSGGGGGMNIIRNWLFDQLPIIDNSAPAWWDIVGSPGFSMITPETGWGKYALRSSGSGFSGISQTFIPRPSTSYRVHVRCKVSSGTIYLATTGGDTDIDASSTSSSWTTVSGTVAADASGSAITISITGSNGSTIDIAAVWCIQGDADMSPSPGLPAAVLSYPAGSWGYTPGMTHAPLSFDIGTNSESTAQLFAVNAELARHGIPVPWNLDESSTVYFVVVGYATTAVASKRVRFKVSHCPVSNGDQWDVAWTDVNGPDTVIDGTQGHYDRSVIAVAGATLGWHGGDTARLLLTRIAAAGGNDLASTWRMTSFYILLPVR